MLAFTCRILLGCRIFFTPLAPCSLNSHYLYLCPRNNRILVYPSALTLHKIFVRYIPTRCLKFFYFIFMISNILYYNFHFSPEAVHFGFSYLFLGPKYIDWDDLTKGKIYIY